MKIDLSCPAEILAAAPPEKEQPCCVLTLFNLADRTIVSCEATIRMRDAQGEETGRAVHRARALNGKPHSAFRMTVPAEPCEGTVSAEAVVDKVWFEDNDVWRRATGNEIEYTPNALPPSNGLNALRAVAGETAVGFPSQQVGLWVCVCGRPNPNTANLCARCRRQKDFIFAQYNRETVERELYRRERRLDLQSRSAREEDAVLQRRREEEYNLRRARASRRKKLITALVCAVALAAGTVFGVIPSLRLRGAVRAMGSGDYALAEETLLSLGSFPGAAEALADCRLRAARRDARESETPETLRGAAAALREQAAGAGTAAGGQTAETKEDLRLANEADFRRAKLMLEAGETDAAEQLFVSLPEDWPGRAEQLMRCVYQRAEEALGRKDYDRARTLYLSLGEWGDAEEKANLCVYEPALTMIENGAYDEAIAALRQISGYADSAELIRKSFYLKGYTLENSGEADAAREAYLAAGDYEDAAERASAILLAKADGLAELQNWEEAIPLYRQLDGYADARDKLVAASVALARKAYRSRDYLRAAEVLDALPEDAETAEVTDLRTRALYQGGKAAAKRGEYTEAIALMERIPGWRDAANLAKSWKYALAQSLVKEKKWEEAVVLLEQLEGYRQANRLLRQAREALAPEETPVPEETPEPENTVEPEVTVEPEETAP